MTVIKKKMNLSTNQGIDVSVNFKSKCLILSMLVDGRSYRKVLSVCARLQTHIHCRNMVRSRDATLHTQHSVCFRCFNNDNSRVIQYQIMDMTPHETHKGSWFRILRCGYTPTAMSHQSSKTEVLLPSHLEDELAAICAS